MEELTGDDVPLLFDRWKPIKFIHRPAISGSGFQQQYHFEYAYVEISRISEYSTMHIWARGMLFPRHAPESLFDSRILEMYMDGKEWMKIQFEEAAQNFPQYGLIDVEEYSIFRRAASFMVEVNDNVLGNVVSTQNRNNVAEEIYHSLEDRLRTEFDFVAAEIDPQDISWFPQGDEEIFGKTHGDYGTILDFGNGTFMLAEFFLTGSYYSNRLDLRIISDENGEKDFHYSVRELSIDYLKREFATKLRDGHNNGIVHVGFMGDGSSWKIDFSKAKFPVGLSQGLTGYLPGK